MGSQQLLLIIVGIIVVGLAVVLGVTMSNSAAESGRMDVAIGYGQSILQSGSAAYMRGPGLGGCQPNFSDWQVPAKMATTSFGSFSKNAASTTNRLVIAGTLNDGQTLHVGYDFAADSGWVQTWPKP